MTLPESEERRKKNDKGNFVESFIKHSRQESPSEGNLYANWIRRPDEQKRGRS